MDVCYLDSETTSLREPWKLGGRRIWEIAAIRTHGATGRLLDVCWLQLADVDLADADPKSLEIGRWADRWTDDEGPRFDAAGDPIAHRAGDQLVQLYGVDEFTAGRTLEPLLRGAVLAGSNPGFDAVNLAHLFDGTRQPATWYHHPRDVPNVAAGWLLAQAPVVPVDDDDAAPGERSWTGGSYQTSTLSEACGIPEPADRHSAMVDAVWMWQWDLLLRGLS